MIKAIIFDCFGVFYVDAQASLQERYPGCQAELQDLRKQSDYGLISKEEYLQAVSQLTGLKDDDVEEIVTHEHVTNKPLLDFIKSDLKGRYKIGVLSNVGRGWLEKLFHEPQRENIFDIIIASGDEGIVKPDLRIFQLAAKRLDVRAEECVMIDDVKRNCEGARAAGMQAIHYEGIEDIKKNLKDMLVER